MFLHGAIFLNIFTKFLELCFRAIYAACLHCTYVLSLLPVCVAVIVYAAKFYENKISFVCTYLVYKLL